MTYAEFLSKQFPEKSVFDRLQFDFHTNFVKWCTLPISYLLFRAGLSANTLDVTGLLLSLCGFFLLSTAASGGRILPLVGILFLFFHVLIDFMDGPIAKARGHCTPLGAILDEVGCHIDRFAIIVLFGFFSGHASLILINIFAAAVVEFLVHQTKDELPKNGFPGFFRKIFVNKFSFFSVRFMLVGIPFLLGIVLIAGWNLKLISTIISFFYTLSAVIWLLICLPVYETATTPPGENE